jgi:hypothetical protein
MRIIALWISISLAALAAAAPCVAADEGCAGFKWDVSAERALFASAARLQHTGKDPAAAGAIEANHLYELDLKPLSQVTFAATSGNKRLTEDSFAGLLALKVAATGSYRFSVDVPLWIDVVAAGKLIPPTDYAGARDCHAPHKIVVFDLQAGQLVIVQLSAASAPGARLTVTQVTPASP